MSVDWYRSRRATLFAEDTIEFDIDDYDSGVNV